MIDMAFQTASGVNESGWSEKGGSGSVQSSTSNKETQSVIRHPTQT
ncbi:hypothetical protein HanXRQr2_Chr05g0224291 [Helianthus annuus]|uniref:Uncharacterized protein n=1 Tax=Helianthus annuus TaxID=4232 RepID=A0A9K3J167_HELAN|nr:hypothetical protein HanXRQr2_Chr05g0224291 [Helianthus annuus]